jgi:hypothetical protein
MKEIKRKESAKPYKYMPRKLFLEPKLMVRESTKSIKPLVML